MPQPYNIPMPDLFEEYQKGVDRARADRAYEAEQRRNAFLSSAFRQYTNPMTGELDRNALLGAVSQAGYGPESLALNKEFQDQEKARIANFADELKNQRNLLGGVSDQASWEAWSANAAARLGPELARFIPPTYSEEAKRKLMLDADKQYEQTYREFGLGGTKEILASPTYGPPSAERVYTGQVTMAPDEMARASRESGGAGYRPRYGTVVDPNDPLQTLAVDLNTYQPGYSVGDPGVRGIATTSTLDAKTRAAREKAYPKVTASLNSFEAKTEDLIELMESLKNDPGLDRIIGPIQALTPTMTKTAGTAEAKLKQILAQGQFRELAAMRVNSPTGGALGNVSNFEVQALQNAFAALDPTQSEESFRRSLDLAIQQLRDSTDIVRQSYEDEYDYRLGGGAAPAGGPDIDSLLQKYQD